MRLYNHTEDLLLCFTIRKFPLLSTQILPAAMLSLLFVMGLEDTLFPLYQPSAMSWYYYFFFFFPQTDQSPFSPYLLGDLSLFATAFFFLCH